MATLRVKRLRNGSFELIDERDPQTRIRHTSKQAMDDEIINQTERYTRLQELAKSEHPSGVQGESVVVYYEVEE